MPWSVQLILVLALAASPFAVYVFRKTIGALNALTGLPKKKLRLAGGAILLWVALYPLTSILSYGLGLTSVSLALQRARLADTLLIYPFWLGLIVLVQLGFFLLPIDLAQLLLYPLHKKHELWWRKVKPRLVIAVICAGSIYCLVRVYIDTYTVRTTRTEFRVAGLPQELEGFRIVQISDIHVDPRTQEAKLKPFVETINNLKPDLILFCGDLVSSGTDFISQGASVMSRLESRHGIYACLGDHDHFSDKRLVTEGLQKNGVTVLDNLATIVPVGSTYLSLSGITNVYRSRPANQTLDEIEHQRLRGRVNIMLTHQPSPWLVSLAADEGYSLFIAGHTHGGQVAFPLPGFLLTGSSFETRYVTGFYRVGGMLVSINNGLGLTLGPVRYHAPAEVTLIELRAKE